MVKANLCFSILGKNSKIQNGRHMWGGEYFLKIGKSTLLRYPVCLWVENFDEIALSRTVKEIEAICVLPFWAKIRKFKMAAICGKRKILKIAKSTLPRVHWENFDEIALSHTVKEIQNGHHFWGGENFSKIARSTLLRYPVA